MARFLFCALAAALALGAACGGDDEGTSGTAQQGGMDDGKLRPDPNGVHITEEEACDRLQSAYAQRRFDLQCPSMTVQACPGFVRVVYDPNCVEFDEGSVQGCIDHWNDTNLCDELAPDNCIATTYPGTVSAGCTP